MAQRITTTSNLHRQVCEAQPLCNLLPGPPVHSTSFIFQQAMTCMFVFNAKSKESSTKILHLDRTLLFVVSLYIRFYWDAFCDRTPPEKGGSPYWEPVHPIVSLHVQSCWNLLLTLVFLHSLLTTPRGLQSPLLLRAIPAEDSRKHHRQRLGPGDWGILEPTSVLYQTQCKLHSTHEG